MNNPRKILNYKVKYSNSDVDADLKYVAKEIVPMWEDANDEDISVHSIVGGITNLLYKLAWKNEAILIRLYGEGTELLIDREKENDVFAQLSLLHFSPIYFGRFTNGRIEQWLDARCLEPGEMRLTDPNLQAYIAKEQGKMHKMDISGSREPVLWNILDRYMHIAQNIQLSVPEKAARLEALNIMRLQSELSWLKNHLPSPTNSNGEALLNAFVEDSVTKQATTFALDVVFSHNDLLSGNVLTGTGLTSVKLIDYEYAGYNFRGFDLANHFCEYCGFGFDLDDYPTDKDQASFFRMYLSVAAPSLLLSLEKSNLLENFFKSLTDAVNRFALASHLFWGIWSVVQAKHSVIDFDFLGYAEKRLAAFHYHKPVFFKEHENVS